MAALAELIQWRDALQAARSAGLRAVQYADGSRAEYKSDAEMAAALADLNRQINAASGASRVSLIRISSSKGV